MKRSEKSRLGKNDIFFTCPSENRLHSARPENALHLKSTLSRMPFYDRVYPEKHWSVSPGIPVVVMKRSLSFIFVPLDEKSSEESTSLEGNYHLTIINNKFLRKVRSKSKLEKSHQYTFCLKCSSIELTCLNLRQAERAKLLIKQKINWKLYFSQNFPPETCGKTFCQKLNATNVSYPFL